MPPPVLSIGLHNQMPVNITGGANRVRLCATLTPMVKVVSNVIAPASPVVYLPVSYCKCIFVVWYHSLFRICRISKPVYNTSSNAGAFLHYLTRMRGIPMNYTWRTSFRLKENSYLYYTPSKTGCQ